MARASNLVIVESPSKAKTIGKYLGPEYTVRASMGHLRDLPKSTMGVELGGNFEPQYVPVAGKEDIINELIAFHRRRMLSIWQRTRTGRARPFPGI